MPTRDAPDVATARRSALECVEEFFQFLELHLEHRVKAKLGHKQQQHIPQQSTQDKAGLFSPIRQITKPPTQIYNPRGEKLELGFHVAPDQEEKLNAIFLHYCAHGEKSNYNYMRRGQFLKFARDCCLISDTLDLIAINLTYVKVNVTSRDTGENEQRLSFREFLAALGIIALRLYPAAGSDAESGLPPIVGGPAGQGASFNQMLEECVFPNAQAVPSHDRVGEALAEPAVLEAMARNQRAMRLIFDFYSRVDDPVGKGVRWRDIVHSQERMSQREYNKFAADFDVTPTLLTTAQLQRCFREANFGPRGSKDTTRLSFAEWEDCLGRCALRAYNFDEESEDAGPVTTFESATWRTSTPNAVSRRAKELFAGELSPKKHPLSDRGGLSVRLRGQPSVPARIPLFPAVHRQRMMEMVRRREQKEQREVVDEKEWKMFLRSKSQRSTQLRQAERLHIEQAAGLAAGASLRATAGIRTLHEELRTIAAPFEARRSRRARAGA